MSKFRPVLRSLAFFGLVLYTIWLLTQKRFDWLIYAGIPLSIFGTIFNMIDDWRRGNKGLVKAQLIAGGIFLFFILIIIAIKNT